MKSRFLFFIFLLLYKSFAQDLSGMLSINLNSKTQSYASVDKNNLNVVLFFINEKKTKAILLDEKTVFIDSLSANPIYGFNKIVAENNNNKISQIVFADDNLSKFLIRTFDFTTRKESSSKFSLNEKDNKLVQVFFYKDNLQTISISKLEKNIVLTSISNEGVLSENVIKAPNKEIQTSIINLNEFSYSSEKGKLPLVLISDSKHNSFSETKSISKCYLRNENFIISLDKNPIDTEILLVNLDDKTLKNSLIKRASSENSIAFNSLIVQNNLIQFQQSKDDFSLEVKNLDGQILKKYSENEFSKGSFFTEIEIGKIDEIDKKKYFKKVNTKELGLSCDIRNNKVFLNLGSTTNARMPIDEEQNTNYTKIGAVSGGLIGGIIGALIDYDRNTTPNVSSYGEIVSKGQTYSQLVLDSDFNSLEAQKKVFSHDKLKKQIVNSNSFSIPTIFMINNIHYLGYYKANEKRYFFKKFID